MSQSGSVNAAASNPQIPIDFVTDSGTAIASGNVINVNGLGQTSTAGAGNTITITSTATATTFTANSGSATPSANNLNVLGSGSTTTSGSGSTITASLTGLTNHSVLIGAGTDTITKVGPSSSTGQVLQSAGLSADPVFSTATYPSSTTISQILYSSSTNAVSGLATANNGLLVTSSAGVPSVLAGPGTSGKVLQSNAAAAPSFSTATFPATATGTGTILRADGTNWVPTTATYPATTNVSEILYSSSASVVGGLTTGNDGLLVTSHTGVPSILAGPGAAGKVLQSNTAAAPSYSTATFPSTATGTGTILRADGTNWVATTATYPTTTSVSNILYSSSASVVGEITTGNDGVLVTSHTGIPSILAGPGATGKVLQSNAAAAPSYSTATFPSTATGTGAILRADGTNWVATTATYPTTTTINQILYSSATSVVTGLATANQGVLTTGATGIPVITALATNGQVIIGSTAGVPAAATITAGAGVTVTNGANSITVASQTQAFSIQTAIGNPADGTIYFMVQTIGFITVTASGGPSRFYIPKAGVINKCYGALVVQGTLGSGQSSTLALRLNNTTDTTVTSSLAATAASNAFNSTSLNITVAAGDFIEFKFTGASWSPTNPTSVMLTATFLVE